ncbi:MAG: 3D-(3,5/4)-trihydroxycyclohexane-1,2-dione acylhydrolase (decyclizing), partial [Bifidobacteriaceae bacterium]|nr:3D-(3,5/4)-trihydroxycyclohexane-1,2-dione acylhydrolase (decyclizing) [Bifidobacteriaceae bacterium]
MSEPTSFRLTVGQAIVRFLANQYSERDGVQHRLIGGVFGILGHGNVCGIGQALLQNDIARAPGEQPLEFYPCRNEQAGVHIASAFAKTSRRLRTMAATSSVGPGALNMVTGAALATTNRLPVLLLPSDVFATRVPYPVLQQLEDPADATMSVNDAFRPVSRFWDRIERAEQTPGSLLAAMRVLTDPVQTGAVTLCLPEDVQAEAFDFPAALFRRRVWRIQRPRPDVTAVDEAARLIRSGARPLIVAGGGVVYSEADAALQALAAATGIPVADTQAGKGAIRWDAPQSVGGLGATGSAAANHLAAAADVVIGIGTRYSDFTTASQTAFRDPQVRFVNINIAPFDAAKQSAIMVVGDARETLNELTQRLIGWHVSSAYAAEVAKAKSNWNGAVDRCYGIGQTPVPSQMEVFGVINEKLRPQDILVNAAGSMPGDLQALWRADNPRQYHVEYAFSCMGYEIPAAMGAKLAAPEAQVVAIVGDGGYQMMPSELATIVQEGVKVVLVLLQNYGFASIGELSESHGSKRFATTYRMRDTKTGQLDGGPVPVDIAANAASYGIRVLKVESIDGFRQALDKALASERSTMIHIQTALKGPNPPSDSWWDVPVAEVSRLAST